MQRGRNIFGTHEVPNDKKCAGFIALSGSNTRETLPRNGFQTRCRSDRGILNFRGKVSQVKNHYSL